MTNKNVPKLTKLEQAMIDDFKTTLVKKLKDEVIMVKLLGSKARGDHHRDSDIDL